MKFRLALVVDYDDSEEGASRSMVMKASPLLGPMVGVDKVAEIQIRKERDFAHFDGASAMAHEIGHVVASALNLPAVQERKEQQRKTLLGIEAEAWQVARLTGLPIDETAHHAAFQTYLDGVEREWKEDGQ